MEKAPSLSTLSSFQTQQDQHWINCLQQLISSQFQRAVIVLSGESLWGRERAKQWIDMLPYPSVLWVSDDIKDALPLKKSPTQLGKEYDAIVFDIYAQFDVDALGAVSGTLRGGGMFFMLLPDVNNWPDLKNSRFLQRALPIFQQHKNVFYFQQNKPFPELPDDSFHRKIKNKVDAPYRTLEQQQVVNEIKNHVLNKKNSAIVLISDRGRGKSSALGLVAGQLLQSGIKNIIVTAPRLTTSDPIFRHAQQLLPEAKHSRGELLWNNCQIKFIAPDALLLEKPQADLLLVDEAAAIPLPMLEELLKHYPVITFATTTHGYEGTGRGFSLKFNKILDRLSDGWQCFKMQEPVRWAEDDPVERWVDKLLCLDAELSEVADIKDIAVSDCIVSEINRDELIKDNKKLAALFALLIFAHYRTKPSDLKHLLDDSKVRVYTLEYQQQILAAALINEEGGFDNKLSSEIYRGERRPAGHLLAQTLTFHAGCEHAATLKYARVMRIAVHPQLQKKGLGSYFLNEIIKKERQQNIVAIGTSFAANPDLIRFWERAGFETVRLGFSRDHISGAHSAVMLKPFNQRGEHVFNEVRGKFQRYLSCWLMGLLKDLPDNMRLLLQKEIIIDVTDLSESDGKEIASFAQTHRGYEACIWPVKKLIKRYNPPLDCLTDIENKLITEKVNNDLSWADIVKQFNLKGKAEAIILLRSAISKIHRYLT